MGRFKKSHDILLALSDDYQFITLIKALRFNSDTTLFVQLFHHGCHCSNRVAHIHRLEELQILSGIDIAECCLCHHGRNQSGDHQARHDHISEASCLSILGVDMYRIHITGQADPQRQIRLRQSF